MFKRFLSPPPILELLLLVLGRLLLVATLIVPVATLWSVPIVDGTTVFLLGIGPAVSGALLALLCYGVRQILADIRAIAANTAATAAALERLAPPVAAAADPEGLSCPHCGKGLASVTPGRNVCAHCGAEFEAE